MSPPLVGPDITLQRPSVSTPSIPEPRNKFPGSTENPFTQQSSSREPDTSRARGIDSGEASPGYRGTPQPTEGSRPGRTLSRAAQAYTPLSQSTPQPIETPRSTQPTPRPNDIPPVTEQPSSPFRNSRTRSPSREPPGTFPQPSPSEAMSQAESEARSRNMQAPTAIPSHMQKPIPRSVPQSQASPEPMSIPRTDFRASPEPMRIPQSIQPNGSTKQNQPRRPEMAQRDSSRSFVAPFMPSPDMRPPSDDSLPERPYGQLREYAQQDNAPSMPDLVIPSHEHTGTSVKPPDDRPTRPRSPSVGDAANPRARRPSPTPANSHKRSVSFNPRLDFNEAPKNRHDVSESDNDSPDTSRRKRHDKERERNRDRDRDHHSHRDKERRGYEAGDDFSDDTPFEDHRRRSRDNGDKDRERRSSRRERSSTQSLDRDQDRDRDRNDDRREKPKRSSTMSGGSHHHRRGRDESPGSDDTEYLPERFDDRGRQKPGSYGKKGDRSPDQDLLAQSLDQILGGIFGKGKK